MIERVIIRKWRESDPVPGITALLHEAYAPLAAMGLRYTATHQDDEVTLARLVRGIAWVGELDGEIIATVTLYPNLTGNSPCGWYRQEGVFTLGQFAVRPGLQRLGLGRRIMDLMETEAAAMGARELALDTAESAVHLVRWHEKAGYRFIAFTDWSTTNYRSVVLSKTLPPPPEDGH